jgi:sulfite exporter TauE/SafE
MPTELTFVAALMVGLLGSTHCIGMCGGIAGALSMGISQSGPKHKTRLLMHLLAYNAGRISSYTLVGIVAGLVGAGIARYAPAMDFPIGKLIAAAFMVALGLYLANWWRVLGVLEKPGLMLWQHIKPLGLGLLPLTNPLQAFGFGLIWGWLPCGLVYAVVAWSMTTGDWLQGALLMFGFGLGTLPTLLILGGAVGSFNQFMRRQPVRTFAGMMMIAFGLYTAISSLSSSSHRHLMSESPPAIEPVSVLELASMQEHD